MPIRRTIKNVVKNYTEAQVKVREATSNDPWGPPSSLMSEIADLTYNVLAFTEIMQIVWKRLNDHGKNWRHVYKSLVLLDYIVKTGSEKVAQQCKENIFALQTLKDFQYIEEGKDHGLNVREKAKQLVNMLKDDERLKNERTKALKAKERFAQHPTGINSAGVARFGSMSGSALPGGSGGYADAVSTGGGYSEMSPSSPSLNSELEAARPSTSGEEDLQLQLALAMSKEEHDEEIKRAKSEDLRLQMAMEESRRERESENQSPIFTLASQAPSIEQYPSAKTNDPWSSSSPNHNSCPPKSAAAKSDPWGAPQASPQHGAGVLETSFASDPWSLPPPQQQHTAGLVRQQQGDPWSAPPSRSAPAPATDPWGAPIPNSGSGGGLQSPSSPWDSSPGESGANKIAATPNGAAKISDGAGAFTGGGGIDDEFDLLSSRAKSPPNAAPVPGGSRNASHDLMGGGSNGTDSFDLMSLSNSLGPGEFAAQQHGAPKRNKSPQSFLGQHANLVNMDNLVSKPVPSKSTNPFSASGPTVNDNPFGAGSGQTTTGRGPMMSASSGFGFQSSTTTMGAYGSTTTYPMGVGGQTTMMPYGYAPQQQQMYQQQQATNNPFL